MKTYTISYKDKSIHYSVEGAGKAIVLLHGFLESLNIWDDFSSALGQEFRIVAIDLPGHGKTGRYSETHSMEFMAETVKTVLDHLKIEKCLMVGHSMGGYVTTEFAAKFPDILSGICLFHSHAAADSDEARQNRTRTINLIEKDRTGFITSFIPNLFSPSEVQDYPREIENLKKIAFDTPNESIIAALRGMMERKDHRELLENLEIPILIIAGKDDEKIQLGVIAQQAILPRHSELIILAGVGHMGYIEAYETTLKIIKSFAERILLD